MLTDMASAKKERNLRGYSHAASAPWDDMFPNKDK